MPTLTRRRFLKNSCLAGAALAVSGAASGLFPLTSIAGTATPTVQETRLLMGTIVTITAAHTSQTRAEEAVGRAFAEMDRLISIFDRFNSRSALSTLNAHGSLNSAPPELLNVLAEARLLGARTNDAFNPAITPLVDLFSAARTSRELLQVDQRDFAEALALSQPAEVSLRGEDIRLGRAGMRLTLDGIAKGYIADAASRVLAENGVKDHMVNAGGDIRVSGFSPKAGPEAPAGSSPQNNKDQQGFWTIGIENPTNNGGILEAVRVTGGGIATSGGYETFYDQSRKHHHIISHRTGQSPAIASVTVKAPTAMQADALATALALMPPTEALRFVQARTGVDCLIIGDQGQRYASEFWG